jgi:hypothetical protein
MRDIPEERDKNTDSYFVVVLYSGVAHVNILILV